MRGQLTVFKIKAVEVKAFDKIPQCLRLKRCHARVAHFTAGVGEFQNKSLIRWTNYVVRVFVTYV